MNVPTRTPEGEPRWCPLCQRSVVIEPSVAPGDATCPRCGGLLWPVASDTHSFKDVVARILESPSGGLEPIDESQDKFSCEPDQLRQALDQLPPKSREMLVLADFHGFGMEEIAQRLGLASATAARIQYCRAIMELASILAQTGGQEPYPKRW